MEDTSIPAYHVSVIRRIVSSSQTCPTAGKIYLAAPGSSDNYWLNDCFGSTSEVASSSCIRPVQATRGETDLTQDPRPHIEDRSSVVDPEVPTAGSRRLGFPDDHRGVD